MRAGCLHARVRGVSGRFRMYPRNVVGARRGPCSGRFQRYLRNVDLGLCNVVGARRGPCNVDSVRHPLYKGACDPCLTHLNGDPAPGVALKPKLPDRTFIAAVG